MRFFKLVGLFICLNLNVFSQKNIDLNDSCNCCHLTTLNDELKTVIKEYNKIINTNGSIYKINYKKDNDSTNNYLITLSNTVFTLLLELPDSYLIFDESLIYIYSEKDCKKMIKGDCLNELFNISQKYSYDKIDVISWNEYKFKFMVKSFEFIDDIPSISFILQNGKIISIKPEIELFYEPQMNPIFID
ncbi:MAG: hypothetical protein A2X08_11455 [Bacteroidetes bacterium GWA2_32_17]|nr:MAG: hypothetical protein A2X08_11455 [Bacteroidetes bacterium GWA2_32_17]